MKKKQQQSKQIIKMIFLSDKRMRNRVQRDKCCVQCKIRYNSVQAQIVRESKPLLFVFQMVILAANCLTSYR